MAAQLHIVAIGCHACDAEEMAGPVLAKYARRGHRATIVALTRGERGHPAKPPEVYGPQLEREMKEAAAILGVDTMWMGFSSGDITVSEHVMAAIAELLRRLRADIVITHWRGSQHPRHTSTHFNVLGAVRLAASGMESQFPPHRVRGVYFGENIADLDGFCPNVYIDITETYEVWIQAMSRYELYTRTAEKGPGGQVVRESPPYQWFYPTMAIVRGHEAGFRYAKAFMRYRECRELF